MKHAALIVDDEPNVRLSYRIALQLEGLEVREAACGATALAEVAAFRFALIILDLRMPEMSGLALLENLRAIGCESPVVIVTAYGDIPHAVKAMKLGAIDFLQKPLLPAELRKTVWDVISRHSSAQKLSNENAFEFHLKAAKRSINLRSFPEAREHIVKALELRSDSPEVFNLAGAMFEMQEDLERARRYYGQAIRLDSGHEAAQQNMRRLQQRLHFGQSRQTFHLGE